jgi:hypothetical protein
MFNKSYIYVTQQDAPHKNKVFTSIQIFCLKVSKAFLIAIRATFRVHLNLHWITIISFRKRTNYGTAYYAVSCNLLSSPPSQSHVGRLVPCSEILTMEKCQSAYSISEPKFESETRQIRIKNRIIPSLLYIP